MRDKKEYQHCDDEYYTACAREVLEMDTIQVERFAKELLNIVEERRRVERQKEIKRHTQAIASAMLELHQMNYTIEIEDEEHSCLFKPNPVFPPIVTVKPYT